jgi:YVTN family beta-propeller protein
MLRLRLGLVPVLSLALGVAGAACSSDPGEVVPDANTTDVAVYPPDAGVDASADADVPVAVLARASRSSTIAITDDDAFVVMVNPQDDSISIFDTGNLDETEVPVGDEPSSVVIHPDGDTIFVANRADATVSRITGLASGTPAVAATIDVGSEPTGVALSPTGKTLFVAEFAEGRIAVIDTSSFAVTANIPNPTNPRSIAVTNDLDDDDTDELLIVPEFFGDVIGTEATDTSRQGRVRIYGLSDLAPQTPILFAPRDSGFAPDGTAPGTPTVMTSPNQLWSVIPQAGKIYVTSISSSPAAPIKFNTNVQPVVYVGDLGSRTEDLSNVGTVNLARKVGDALAPGTTRFFLADIVDMDFKGTSNIAYVVSRGADVVQRVIFDPALGVTLGSTQNVQIDIGATAFDGSAGCQNPTGIITATGVTAYVNCWANKRLGVVDLSNQRLSTTVAAGNFGGTPEELGRRFYFTGRGRWSKEGWSSCGSCHPDGLTDNMTWVFGTGPRQTTSMDGSFSHGPGIQKQRIFNWTGVFDEMHDFERNTRGTSGGLGAVTIATPGGACVKDGGTLATEVADPLSAALPGGLGQPIKELQDRPENCTQDWDKVDAFSRTIRPPRALRFLDAASVARGADLFGEPSASANNGGCVRCHGGAGWTVSRRFWTPSAANNTALATTAFVRPLLWPASWNIHTLQIEAQLAAADTTGANVAPPQVSCVIRDLDTFGVPGDTAATDALELKDTATRAQGAGGYNVPSLYGLAVGAPYLHHGQAHTLQELFDDTRWQTHLQAGNTVFLVGDPDAAEKKADLINFLLSIDPTIEEATDFDTRFGIPAGFDGCPVTFP